MKYLSAIVAVVLIGCVTKHNGEKKTGLLSNFVSISDNEDRGVKEIIATYGGQCEYGFKSVVSTEGNKQLFWLKFTKSQLLDTFPNLAKLAPANIAYIFFKNLDNERTNYDAIESEVILYNNESMKLRYDLGLLETVKQKYSVLESLVELIKNKDFETIKTRLTIDTSLYNFDKIEFVNKNSISRFRIWKYYRASPLRLQVFYFGTRSKVIEAFRPYSTRQTKQLL